MICTVVLKQINLIIMKKENYIFGLKQNLKIISLGIVFFDYIFRSDFDSPGDTLPLTNSTVPPPPPRGIIKITIKANQIDMDVFLISKLDNIHTKTMFVPIVWLFSIILLACEFYPHGQTWYQKFLGTYLPLKYIQINQYLYLYPNWKSSPTDPSLTWALTLEGLRCFL